MSNFDKLVQARIEKTGESWATAARNIRAQVAEAQPPPPPDLVSDDDVEAQAAAVEPEDAYRKFAELEALYTPFKQMTALRDAMRSPFENFTSALRNPLADAIRMQNSLVSPLRDLRSSLGEATQLMGYRTSLGEAALSAGHLAERVNNASIEKAFQLAEQFENASKHLMPATGLLEEALTTFDRLMPPDPFEPFKKLVSREKLTSLADPVATEPTFRPRRVVRDDPPPPEALDVEIEPRCQRCGAVLKGELLLEKKPWAGPGKIKGELRVEVCKDCVKKCGGDPGALPGATKHPLD